MPFLSWCVLLIVISVIGIVLILFLERKGFANILYRLRSSEAIEMQIESSSYAVDYDKYLMSNKQKLTYLAISAIAVWITSYIFYRSIIISFMLIPFSTYYLKIKKSELIRKRRTDLNLQFRDALYSVSSSLMAGKSIEASFKSSLRDLSIQYSNPETYIIRELNFIVYKLELNNTLESIIEDLANRSKLEDIKNFAEVMSACKRTGGDLVQVIKSTTDIINEKIYIKQEIDNLIVQRKLEQKILSLMPIALFSFLSLSAGDFIMPVFTTLQGKLSITAALILFIASYFISRKIMNIEV